MLIAYLEAPRFQSKDEEDVYQFLLPALKSMRRDSKSIQIQVQSLLEFRHK